MPGLELEAVKCILPAMQAVDVSLGVRSYRIWIGRGLLERIGQECAGIGLGRKCAVITDTNVGRLYAESVCVSLRNEGFDPVVIEIKAGEASKSLRTAEDCYEKLVKAGLDRKSFIVALGGGVVGDLGGFVAATYMRGIKYVQVPTSLLAQVDSSVGGKVAVNLKQGKNLVGVFYQPVLVICDVGTLVTLPEREYISGLAEVIKYGVIADSRFFNELELHFSELSSRHLGVLEEVITRCCQIKADVVSRDETESGLRQILNFGHTIGHAIEAVCGYGRFLHGEAVAIGMVGATYLSTKICGLPESERARIVNLLKSVDLPVAIRITERRREKILQAMKVDKKAQGGEIKFVLAKRIGEVVWGQTVRDQEINMALDAISA